MWESGPSWSIMPCPLLIVTQVTHGYLTPLTLQPLDQYLLAPHLIHGTVEQCIHVLLLLLTNLPLDGVAPTGGYVGDLQVQDAGYSPASVLMVNTPLRPPQRPLRASLTVSVSILMGWYSRNLTGGSRASTLTCLQPWHRPSRPADQHWVLERRSETLESILVALFFSRLR
jgi:hypothetical protein